MKDSSKLQIYRGIIQYLLESTNYTLKNIADLSGASIVNIRSIYLDNHIPSTFTSELALIKVFLVIFQIDLNCNATKTGHCAESMLMQCMQKDKEQIL